LNRVRELLKNGAIGWTVAGLCLLLALTFLYRAMFATNTYDLARLSEEVTVRFTDTDDEIKLRRGEFEKRLRQQPEALSKTAGLINPKTGKPTGILVATREWEETVDRLNEEREWAKHNSAFGKPGSPPPSPAPKR